MIASVCGAGRVHVQGFNGAQRSFDGACVPSANLQEKFLFWSYKGISALASPNKNPQSAVAYALPFAFFYSTD